MSNSNESKIINYFQSSVTNGLSRKLGVILSDDNEILYNHFAGNTEYDILIKGGKRLMNGVPLSSVLNVEVETSRCTAGTINSKYDGDKLLSFILCKGISRNGLESDNFYSLVNFRNREGFSQELINYKNRYAKRLISEREENAVGNLNVLERILKTSMNEELKNGVLFFLGDLLTDNLRINNKRVKRVFFEPHISMIRLCIGKKGEKCFFDNSMIREKVKNRELRNLENPYSTNSYSSNDAVSLITHKNYDEEVLNELCSNSEVDKIYYTGGTKLEVRAGSSLIKKVIN